MFAILGISIGWQAFPISVVAVILLLYLIRWADKKSTRYKPFRISLDADKDLYKYLEERDVIEFRGELVCILEYDPKTGTAWVTRDLDPSDSMFWRRK